VCKYVHHSERQRETERDRERAEKRVPNEILEVVFVIAVEAKGKRGIDVRQRHFACKKEKKRKIKEK